MAGWLLCHLDTLLRRIPQCDMDTQLGRAPSPWTLQLKHKGLIWALIPPPPKYIRTFNYPTHAQGLGLLVFSDSAIPLISPKS